MNNSGASASINTSVNIPNWFDCKNCAAWNHRPSFCDKFQTQGRCAKATLHQALLAGTLSIPLPPMQSGGPAIEIEPKRDV